MKKYYGKEKCRILKQIRAEIAKQNDIEWVVSECQHQGNCRGTCPKCEAEVRELERALARREAMGKTVAVVGISAGIALGVTGCDLPLTTTVDGEMMPPVTDTSTETEEVVLSGVPMPPETQTETQTETDIGVDGEMYIPEDTLMGDPVPDDETSEDEDELMGEWEENE